jgi:predicted secreted protein
MPASPLSYHRRRHIVQIAVASALLLCLLRFYSAVSFAQNTPAPTATPIIEETFVLKYLKPSALVTFLAQGEKKAASAKTDAAAPQNVTSAVLLPASIKSVSPDDVFNTVTVQGAPEAIAAIRKVASLLDVPPQPVRMNIRIIRYRSVAAQNAGAVGNTNASLADVEEVASGIVETASNSSVEITTFGDRHAFRARLVPHINNAASITVSADLQMAAPDGSFAAFSAVPSGTRMLRVGDRGLITSAGTGISAPGISGGSVKPAPAPTETKPKAPEKAAPETYYLEVAPTIPPSPSESKAAPEPPATKP